jgi:hypothetical protein
MIGDDRRQLVLSGGVAKSHRHCVKLLQRNLVETHQTHNQGVEMLSKGLTVLVAASILGCASTPPEEESVIKQNDAVDDYIRVAELPETDAIRKRGELHYAAVTEKYIVLSDRKNSYLAVFSRRCREPAGRAVTPDIRRDANILRARFDTYRGCRIRTLYEITEGQAQELLGLGERPGK